MGNLKHSNHKKESIKTKNLISMPNNPKKKKKKNKKKNLNKMPPPPKKKKLKITKDRE